MSGKWKALPNQCIFHILHAAVLCMKMNYQTVSKVNQKFFLVIYQVRPHWSLELTGHQFQSALSVFIKYHFSFLLKLSFSPLYGNEKTNNNTEYPFFRISIFQNPFMQNLMYNSLCHLAGRQQRQHNHKPLPTPNSLAPNYKSLFQKQEKCDAISADGDSQHTIKSICMKSPCSC